MCAHIQLLNPFVCLASFGWIAAPAVGQLVVVHSIAVTGDAAPDRAGAFFDGFNALSLNAGGDVAIVAQTGFNDGGIWQTADGTLSLVTDSSFNETIHLSDDGRLVHVNGGIIQIFNGVAVTVIAEWMQPAPTRPDVTIRTLDTATFGDAARFLFTASVQATTPPFDAVGPGSLWEVENGMVRAVALGGDPAPGVGPNYEFQSFPPGTRALSGDGDIYFVAYVIVPGFPGPTETGVGLFADRNGTIELLYRDGEPVPGLSNGETFVAFQNVQALSDGSVSFRAILDGPMVDATNRLAWFVDGAGGLELVLRTGEPAPGLPAGTNYRALRDVHFAEDGISFISVTNDMPDPQLGTQRLWSGPGDDLAEIVSADWLAEPPGMEGETATLIRLTGDDSGLFLYQTADVIGDAYIETLRLGGLPAPRRIVGVGDVIAGRVVSALLQHELNESAEIAVHLRFDDDSDGVFLFALLGDFDRDADVDMPDFLSFSQCFAGQNEPPSRGCPPNVDGDFDDDGDVDVHDFGRFAQSFTGAR